MRKIAFASLSCLLAACGQSGSNTACPTNAESAASVYSQPPEHKLDLNFSPSSIVRAGTSLTAIVYDGCETEGPITSSIPDLQPGQTGAGVRSYSWIAARDYTFDELEGLAERDACLHMLTENVIEQTPEIDPSQSDADVLPLSLPSDPQASIQAHLTAIGAPAAYDIFYKSGSGITRPVVIAIVDSGVDLNHEDLKGNLWRNPGEIAGNGKDDDGNGYVDDVYGYNFASRIPSPMYQKSSANGAWQYAHGTRVAGLAAAVSNNGKGGTGVMGTAKIMALNVMGTSSSMSQSSIANAIRYAADNGADVINLSLGSFNAAGTDYKSALQYAARKGVAILAAAGNESTKITSSYSAAGQATSIAGLLSIANLRASDMNKSTRSNYSSTYVELGAPGTTTQTTGLYSTAPGNSYGYFSGTSAAAPVASGAAGLAIGLIKSRGYSYTAGDIENLMVESGRTLSALTPYIKGGKALDLAALARLIDSRYPVRGTGIPPVAGGGGSTTPPSNGGGDSSNVPPVSGGVSPKPGDAGAGSGSEIPGTDQCTVG